MILDLVFALLMAFAIFKGYSRGLVVAVFSVLAFIIGIAAAIKLSAVVAGYLGQNMHVSNKWLPVLSFAIVFIVVLILVRLGAKLVAKTFKFALLGWADKLGGILLYILLYTVIFSVVLFYINQMGLIRQETISSSATYAYIEPWGPRAIEGFGKVVPLFKGMFAQLESFFDGVAKKAS